MALASTIAAKAMLILQFSQQVLQSNPKYQQQLQQDQLFQANLQKYIENLQFSVQQQQNAVTGRLGVQQ
jgi:sortase (surface protein transpeptidase)